MTDVFEPDDLERLVERAERDPDASAELEFLADLVAAAEIERAALLAAPTARPRLVRWIAVAAAGVLLVLAAAWWSRRERTPELESARRTAPLYVASALRSDEEGGADFDAAMAPYARADWNAAARALEAFLGAHPDHGPALFYLAGAEERLGHLDEAAAGYARASAAPDRLLADHARFRLALLRLARGERAEARAALEALAVGGGELALNARELLDGLGKP